MVVAQVDISVMPEHLPAFLELSKENARASLQDSGVARFDIIQSQPDPNAIIFIEIYKTMQDRLKHRETPHFKRWFSSVEGMMAQPREAKVYDLLSLDNDDT